MQKEPESQLAVLAATATSILRKEAAVGFAVLFGSSLGPGRTVDSDLDLAVWLDPLSLPGDDLRLRLTCNLMDGLKLNNVDLTILNLASPLLAHQALRNGRLLLVRDRAGLEEFMVRTLRLVWDLDPLRDIFRRNLLARNREAA